MIRRNEIVQLLSFTNTETVFSLSIYLSFSLSLHPSVPQKRRSSRQVKRKRYTEDLEFRISEDDDSDNDSSVPKSPSSSSQQQVQLSILS